MSTEAPKFEIPKLPQLDKEDVKAVRSFLPGKLLSRTAAFLSLVLLVLGFVIAIKVSLGQFPDLERGIPPWAYGVLFGLCFLAVVAQAVVEWRAERTRRSMQILAVKPGAEQTGYFRIGPYQNTLEDRAKFKRTDHAEEKALEWINKSNQVPLYLCGDSGSGKSSLLNAFVLPKMREQRWTVVETRAWQDPERALRDALLKLPGARRQNAESQGLRELVEDAAEHASAKDASVRLLIVLDQFEEFVILAKPEQQQTFAAFVGELSSRPVKGLALLLVMRSEYQVPLEATGLPLLRNRENLLQVGRFTFPAAGAFITGSGLDLQPDAIDRLLTSAAELDETPGMVRPITLNVVGYVLASGNAVAPSLDAGVLIRRYIERTVEQPAIRDGAPQLLEQMITEQGTKRPRSEAQLIADTRLRRAEVRAVLNGLDEAGLARTLDKERAEWELSHDFIAHAVGRFLGRRRTQVLRRTGAYAAPALLAVSLFGGLWMNESYLKERMLQAQKLQEEALLVIVQQKQALLEEVRRNKGLPNSVLVDILARLGETVSADDPAQIEEKLRDKAEEYVKLHRQLDQLASDGPRVPALRKELFDSIRARVGDPAQYVIDKWKLAEVHSLSTGKGVIVAVIDSAIDKDHPDLAGTVISEFDAGCGAAAPDAHATAMAGAIAAHGALLGVAPDVKIIAICAFGGAAAPQSTAINIINGLDYAIRQGARIVNMGFAGQLRDPALAQALQMAHDKGIVLISNAGNGGPKSPPLYPGADPNVIAVTATDADDHLFNGANQGRYVAVAAPGVDVLVPAPNGGVQLTTGTSVATAEVSGVAALLIAQKPSRTPDEIRTILMSTAKHLGAKGVNPQFGAGLVDPLKALQQAPRI